MPLLSQGELRQLLGRDLPGALAPPTRAAQPGNGRATSRPGSAEGASAQQERQATEAGTSADTSPAPADADSAALAHPEPEQHEGEGASMPQLNDNDAVVLAERLPEVMRYLRDRQGYTYLSHITAVDYLQYGIIEVIYHLYNADQGGAGQMIRVRVPREAASIPSISPWWPGANLQEREAWDLYGVRFPGHPYHHRIYMWEELEGHPMRKDFEKIGDTYYHFKWKGDDSDAED